MLLYIDIIGFGYRCKVGFMDIGLVVITLSIIVLLVVVVQFNEILGKRTGRERTVNNIHGIKTIKEKLISGENSSDMSTQIINVENILSDIDELAPKDSSVNTKLRQIYDLDKNFSPKLFINEAIEDYEKILNAFTKEDLATVESKLTDKVKDSFKSQIDDYKAKEQRIEFNFIGNAKANIVDIKIVENVAYIAIRFISEAVFALYNKADELIQGRSHDLTILDESWVFKKELADKVENWRICATNI